MEIINRKPWKYRVFYSFHAGCAQPMEIINRKPANFPVRKAPRIRPSPELEFRAISTPASVDPDAIRFRKNVPISESSRGAARSRCPRRVFVPVLGRQEPSWSVSVGL